MGEPAGATATRSSTRFGRACAAAETAPAIGTLAIRVGSASGMADPRSSGSSRISLHPQSRLCWVLTRTSTTTAAITANQRGGTRSSASVRTSTFSASTASKYPIMSAVTSSGRPAPSKASCRGRGVHTSVAATCCALQRPRGTWSHTRAGRESAHVKDITPPAVAQEGTLPRTSSTWRRASSTRCAATRTSCGGLPMVKTGDAPSTTGGSIS